MLWRLIFGPLPRRNLGQKLLIAFYACAMLAVFLLILLNRLPPGFEGDLVSWMSAATGVGLVVLCFTSWSVVCSHGLGKIAEALAPRKEV